MTKIDVIFIENLKCGGCENSIKNALRKMDGVETIFINHQDQTVSVVHDELTKRASLTTTLRSLGYPEVGTTEGLDKVLHNAKSYVSCAIGRVTA